MLSYITTRDHNLMRRLNESHLERRGGSDNPLESRIQSLEMAFRIAQVFGVPLDDVFQYPNSLGGAT